MLIDSLKTLLGTVKAFKIKAQNYHWNVTGPDFSQYHKFLNDIYDSADEDVDAIAEHIRALDAFAPGSFKRFSELSRIEDEESIPSAIEMLRRLAKDNETIHSVLMEAHEDANNEKQFGVVNFIEGLLDANEKLQWMLNSHIK